MQISSRRTVEAAGARVPRAVAEASFDELRHILYIAFPVLKRQ